MVNPCLGHKFFMFMNLKIILKSKCTRVHLHLIGHYEFILNSCVSDSVTAYVYLRWNLSWSHWNGARQQFGLLKAAITRAIRTKRPFLSPQSRCLVLPVKSQADSLPTVLYFHNGAILAHWPLKAISDSQTHRVSKVLCSTYTQKSQSLPKSPWSLSTMSANRTELGAI